MEQFDNELEGEKAICASPVVVLVLGILGVTGCLCLTALPAVIIGGRTLEAIDEKRYPDKDRSLAYAGYLLGQVGLVLTAIFVLLFVAMLSGD